MSFENDENVEKESNQSSHEKYAIDFNVVMKEIGSMGKYQILLVLLAYWVTIPSGMNQVASVFLEATPYYRCALPPLDNKAEFPSLTEDDLKNYTLPIDPRTGEYDQCRRYNYNLSQCIQNNLSQCITPYPPTAPEVVAIPCDNGYWYDTSVYTNTVTTEFNIVCDQTIIGAVVTAVYFCGILLSSLIGGNIADIFGRTPTMVVSQICMAAVGIGCAFAPNLVGYAGLRFTLALFLQAGYIACFVYVMEITGERWRTFVGINVQAVFAVGYITLSGFAYGWRNWRDLQLAISFVPLPFVIFWFFMPESPRWLFTKGKVEKAKKNSEMMAKRNGNQLTSDVWERAEEAGRELAKKNGNDQKNYSPLELFKRPRMRLITLNVMFNWFVNSLVYYGLSLNSGQLAGDDFLNNTLNGLVEFVAYFTVIVTMDRFGRRPLLAGCLLTGGIACLASTVANNYSEGNQAIQNTATAFALIGKMAVSGSFAIIYNFTAELYPTIVRSTAVGIGSMSARVGSIITPFTLQLQYIIPWLTSVIFGVLALVAGLASFAFPETLGHEMLTSLDEAEEFYKGGKSASKSEEEEDGYTNAAFDVKSSAL